MFDDFGLKEHDDIKRNTNKEIHLWASAIYPSLEQPDNDIQKNKVTIQSFVSLLSPWLFTGPSFMSVQPTAGEAKQIVLFN